MSIDELLCILSMQQTVAHTDESNGHPLVRVIGQTLDLVVREGCDLGAEQQVGNFVEREKSLLGWPSSIDLGELICADATDFGTDRQDGWGHDLRNVVQSNVNTVSIAIYSK